VPSKDPRRPQPCAPYSLPAGGVGPNGRVHMSPKLPLFPGPNYPSASGSLPITLWNLSRISSHFWLRQLPTRRLKRREVRLEYSSLSLDFSSRTTPRRYWPHGQLLSRSYFGWRRFLSNAAYFHSKVETVEYVDRLSAILFHVFTFFTFFLIFLIFTFFTF
jgi:hypothetical protein